MLTLGKIIAGVHVFCPIILIKQQEHFIEETYVDTNKRPEYLLDSVVD